MDEHFIKLYKWLYPASWIYGAVVNLRNKLFDWEILRSKSFDVPVICIGNIAAGGTGKTPHTEYLIKLLHDKYQVAVLSRGYKRNTKGYILSTTESNVRSIGDEPYQIQSKFPHIWVAVDEKRSHGIDQLLLLKKQPVEVILLDDAFQHRYVKAGLNILLTDYHRLFCDDALLPAGRLREPTKGKNRAQIVIVTKCPQDMKPIDFNIITKRLKLFPYQQLFFSAFRYGNLQAIFPGESSSRQLLTLKETYVLLVSGIASPTPMIEKLNEYTQHIKLLSFSDHHNFTTRDMQNIKEQFVKLGDQQKIIITTEKDATRLVHHPSLDEALKPYIYTLPIEIEILQNQQNSFNQLIISYVRENKRNSSLSESANAH